MHAQGCTALSLMRLLDLSDSCRSESTAAEAAANHRTGWLLGWTRARKSHVIVSGIFVDKMVTVIVVLTVIMMVGYDGYDDGCWDRWYDGCYGGWCDSRYDGDYMMLWIVGVMFSMVGWLRGSC